MKIFLLYIYKITYDNNFKCLFHFRNFEKSLITSGKELNILIHPINRVYDCFSKSNSYLCDIQSKVINFFREMKNRVDLIVVIIPENNFGLYGK